MKNYFILGGRCMLAYMHKCVCVYVCVCMCVLTHAQLLKHREIGMLSFFDVPQNNRKM